MQTGFLKYPASLIESVFDRTIASAGAVIFSQIPSFLVQYQQRLGGHVDELAILIKKYKAAASDNGRTIEEYIGLHLQSSVKEFAASGKIMSGNIERFTELSSSLKNLSESSGLFKFIHFLKDADSDIFNAAYKNFVPGLSFSADTVLYGLTGIIVFMSVYFIIKKSLLFIINKVKSR